MDKIRCQWSTGDELLRQYHDEIWGVPVYDDTLLFEMLVLEMMQAGLSFLTVLKKKENFKKAFADYNIASIIVYDDNKVQELLLDKGIIRHRLKILAVINNARLFKEIQKKHGSFSNFIWSYTDKPIINNYSSIKEIPSRTELSDKISRDLKKLGFKFVGTTIIYAYLQAIGLVNDHTNECFCKRKKVVL